MVMDGQDSSLGDNYGTFNHPGGFQVIGDYAVVPVEDGSSSYVHLYDIGDISASCQRQPVWVRDLLHRPNALAGAVGITNYTRDGRHHYLLAIFQRDILDLYDDVSDTLVGAQFQPVGSLTLPHYSEDSYQSIHLFTNKVKPNEDEKVFIIGFRSQPYRLRP